MAYRNRERQPSVVTIARKTLPATRATVMRDFMEILVRENLYKAEAHNKTDNNYLLYNTLFEFIGLDQPQKVRGRKRNVAFMNEANEFSHEDFIQLALRTTDRMILDYNPSDEFHWIYDKVNTRDDCAFFKTTYLDNPFLPPETIQEIERLKEVDENYWRVFGLGERGSSKATIYTHWQECLALPEGGEEIWGLDFGYNHPSAMIQVKLIDNVIYARERLHQSGLTNSQLIQKAREFGIQPYTTIYADSARPEFIDEFISAGFNCQKSDKDVQKGIDSVRSRKLFITKDSVNLIKEIKSYKYKEDQNGKILEDPVKINDDGCDALRYAVHTYFNNPDYGKYAVG